MHRNNLGAIVIIVELIYIIQRNVERIKNLEKFKIFDAVR